MTGHIPDTFIDELLNRIDIIDIVQARIELKRAGSNFVARCPFHAEKTPSFSVNQSKQFYHCFGCGAHGNAIRFLMEYDGMHFVDVIDMLANRVGLVVPKHFSNTEYDALKQNTEIYEILAKAAEFYHKNLLQTSSQDLAYQYIKTRGIAKQTVLDFHLGYAPKAWDHLFHHLATDKNKIDILMAAGLIITKENKPYFDRFHDRIMFPIRNRRGQVVGFGGRIIKDGNPKYLNSPETKVFNKSHELYGLYEAKMKLKKLQTLIVVEGYLDVITLSQFGIKNVVATLGTALTEKHLEVLFKEVKELIFCFDGDKAGRGAALRVLLLSLPVLKEGYRIRFMLLPENEDPDSYMRKRGKDAFEEGIHRAKNLSDFLFDSYLTNIDLNQLEGRAEYVRRLRPLIQQVPSPVLQHMLFERLGELARISTEKLLTQTEENTKYPLQQKFKKNLFGVKSLKNQGPLPAAYKASAFLLANPSLIRYINTPHCLERGNEPGSSLLCAIIEILLTDSQVSTKHLLEQLKTAEGLEKEISYIANFNDIIAMVPEEGREAEFLGALERLKERLFDVTLEALLTKAKTAPLSVEEKIELKGLLDRKERGT